MKALLSRGAVRNIAFFAFAAASAAIEAVPVSPVPLSGAARTEAPATLLAVDLEDGEAEVFIGGSWKGELTGTGGLTLGSSGPLWAQSDSPLLFSQTIDLTLSALILKRWFVEANFLDDYDLNTYRAGYLGAEGDAIRYVGIGNVGLDFPAFPYIDISGGTPSSFGAYAAFGSGPIGVHALVRYDSASRAEKVFVGARERTQTDISPAKRLRGRSFVLPDAGLDSLPVVYLEDADSGTLAGSDGRKYRAAAASEAAVSATLGLVELSAAPAGRVAVAYSKSGSNAPWTSSLGAYAPASGFLGGTQEAFDAAGAGIDLSSYPQPGGGAGAPAAISIGAAPALVVYDSAAFSPFEHANRYAPAAGTAADSSAELVRASRGIAVPGFELESSTSLSFSVLPNQDGTATASTSGRYFVLDTALGSADRRSADSRFPLAAIDPGIYVPGSKGSATDIVVRFTSYGSPGSYDIGTDVVAGSVVVSRGGARDPLAVYDPSTGTVALSSPAGPGEIIRISYLKNAQDRRFGSLAAGLGAVYEGAGGFSARAALALRWNVSGDAFTTSSESSPGTIAFSGSAAWRNGDLKAEAAAALSYEAPDTTGLYRAAGMEGTETALGLSVAAAGAAYPPTSPAAPPADAAGLFAGPPTLENRGKLIYRNYMQSDLLGNSALKPITWTGASVDSSKNGPYPVSVAELDGKTAYVAEYDLGAGKAETGGSALWAGFQMQLGSEAEALERARKIIVPYRHYDLEGGAPLRAYAQIGTIADEDGASESAELVWSAPLGIAVAASGGSQWASASIDLADLDRARLAGARSLRIVVRMDGTPGAGDAAAGKLLVLPPVFQGAAFRPVVVSSGDPRTAGDEAAAAETLDPTLAAAFPAAIKRLHPDGEAQRVLEIEWDDLGAAVGAVGADGYPGPFPLWAYRSLSFYLRGPSPAPDSSSIRIVVAADSGSLAATSAGERFVDASIPASAFTADRWSKVDIRYEGSGFGVRVDGERIAEAVLAYRADLVRSYRNAASAYGEREGPRYLAVLLEADDGGQIQAGSFAVDEFCLEEPTASFGASAGGAVSWKLAGPLLSLGGKALVSDFSVEARSDLSAFGNPLVPDAGADGSAARGSGSMSARVLGVSVSASAGAASAAGASSWTGAHRAEAPLGKLKAVERFSIDADSSTLSRGVGLSYSGPVRLEGAAALDIQNAKTVRTWKTAAAAAGKGMSASADLSAAYTGKDYAGILGMGYGEAWIESWSALVPDPGEGQSRRELRANSAFSFSGGAIGFGAAAAGSSQFNAAAATRADIAELKISLPIKLARWEANGAFIRSASFTEEGAGGDAFADADAFARALSRAAPLWTSPPLSSLGDSKLASDFGLAADRSIGASFVDRVETTLTLPRAFGASALFIPANASLSVSRSLQKKLETETDTLGTAASVSYSSVNLFGAFGSAPRFSFYKSDEFAHSIKASASFPRGEGTEWEIGFRQSLAFFGFTTAKLALVNNTRFGSEGWSQGSALSWTAPQPKSLLKTLYGMAVGAAAGWKQGPLLAELAAADAVSQRRETLELTVSAADDVAWSWKLKHEALLNAAGKLALSAFGSVGASGGETDGERKETVVDISIGLSLTLKF